MSRRQAPIRPIPTPPEQSVKQFNNTLGIDWAKLNDPNYDALRPDKRKVPPMSIAEAAACDAAITRKMKECFGPRGGEYRIFRVVKGTTEEYVR